MPILGSFDKLPNFQGFIDISKCVMWTSKAASSPQPLQESHQISPPSQHSQLYSYWQLSPWFTRTPEHRCACKLSKKHVPDIGSLFIPTPLQVVQHLIVKMGTHLPRNSHAGTLQREETRESRDTLCLFPPSFTLVLLKSRLSHWLYVLFYRSIR